MLIHRSTWAEWDSEMGQGWQHKRLKWGQIPGMFEDRINSLFTDFDIGYMVKRNLEWSLGLRLKHWKNGACFLRQDLERNRQEEACESDSRDWVSHGYQIGKGHSEWWVSVWGRNRWTYWGRRITVGVSQQSPEQENSVCLPHTAKSKRSGRARAASKQRNSLWHRRKSRTAYCPGSRQGAHARSLCPPDWAQALWPHTDTLRSHALQLQD